jgi:cis-L-3-hydroxyproline dehydratase
MGRYGLGQAAMKPDTFCINGLCLVDGEVSGKVLHAITGLSFWGGVDSATGIVIDRRHPLHGQCLTGAIVAIPSGRGSCSASGVMLELLRAGTAPAGLVFCEEEQILTLAVILAEEVFGQSIPVLQLNRDDFARIGSFDHATIRGAVISESTAFPSQPATEVREKPALAPLMLTDADHTMLEGANGPARQAALKIIVRIAESFGAPSLIDVERAHLDCCILTGPASVEIAERFRDLGGIFAVPTTLNAISTDLRNWKSFNLDPEVASQSARQAKAYMDMGAALSFTCAPYLLENPPVPGQQIAWAESNAVVFANSVLGARTQKYPDYLDLCIALTGRAPLAGCHQESGRFATRVIALTGIGAVDDSFYPLFGYLAGLLSPNDIPAITGLEKYKPTADDLKGFSAAFATTSAAPMFHIAGVTPEAPTLKDALGGHDPGMPVTVTVEDLKNAWRTLNLGDDNIIGLVALGNPHFSSTELARLAILVEGLQKSADVQLIVTTSRAVLAQAEASGTMQRLDAFGVRFITDTCWCMLGQPVTPPKRGGVITNSAKYAHYGPNLSAGSFRYHSLEGCVEAACTGRAPHEMPTWLRSDEAAPEHMKTQQPSV